MRAPLWAAAFAGRSHCLHSSIMAAAATVIASQAALDEGALEGGRLEQLAAARGLRVRRAAGTPADLMASKAGFTLPFLLWRSGSGGSEGSSGGGGGSNVARIERLASMFKQVGGMGTCQRQAWGRMQTVRGTFAKPLQVLPAKPNFHPPWFRLGLQAYVLLPYELLGQPSVLDAVSRLATIGHT